MSISLFDVGGQSRYIDFDSEAADSGSFEMEPDLKETEDFLASGFIGFVDPRTDPFPHADERTIMDWPKGASVEP